MAVPSVRRTRPPAPPPQTVQCGQPFEEVRGSNGYPLESYFESRRRKLLRRGFDPARCGKGATWEVDGRAYCAVHAGIAALRILEGGGRATASEPPSDTPSDDD